MHRYTKDELVGRARAEGFEVTARLVDDWIEVGLLGSPEHHGKGQGKGSTRGTWSEQQANLFLTVLGHRRTVSQIPLLCNVPVWGWLYEDDADVHLRQVKRALRTWGGLSRSMSWKMARRTAESLLSDLGHPETPAKDRKEFVEQMSTMFYRGKFDRAAMVKGLTTVFDPHGSGLAHTFGGIAAGPEEYAEIVEARWTALRALEQNKIPDSMFHWARYSNVVVRRQYSDRLQAMMGSAIPPEVTRETSMEGMLNSACKDLLTLLGVGLNVPVNGDPRDITDPKTWQEQGLRSTAHIVPRGSQVQLTTEVIPGKKPRDDHS
jgi:hypothetical protein